MDRTLNFACCMHGQHFPRPLCEARTGYSALSVRRATARAPRRAQQEGHRRSRAAEQPRAGAQQQQQHARPAASAAAAAAGSSNTTNSAHTPARRTAPRRAARPSEKKKRRQKPLARGPAWSGERAREAAGIARQHPASWAGCVMGATRAHSRGASRPLSGRRCRRRRRRAPPAPAAPSRASSACQRGRARKLALGRCGCRLVCGEGWARIREGRADL